MRELRRAEDLYEEVSSKGVDIWEYVEGLKEDQRQAVLRVLKDSMKYVTISKEGESYVTSEEVTASYNVSGRALPEEEGYSTEFKGVYDSEGEESDLKVTKVSRGVYEVRKKEGEGSYGRAEIMEYEVKGEEGEEPVKCLVKKSSFREELEQEYEGWQREHQPIRERYLSLSSDEKRARFISENSQIIEEMDSAKLQLIREGHRYPMPSLLQRVVQVTEDPKVVKQIVDEMGYLTTTRIYGELVNFAGSDGNTAFQIARAKHIDVAKEMLWHLSLYGEVKEESGAGRESEGLRMRIDTHTSSVHRSTDTSVVKLFVRYVEENGLGVDYEKLEEWKIRIKDRAREEAFAARMEEEIAILHAKVDEWNSLDEEGLRSKGTAAMSESELVTLKKNLKYAKRLLDNIKENGMLSIAGSYYTNDSRREVDCGLTIKEIMGLVSYYVRSCRGVEMRAGVAEEKQQEDLMIRYMQHLKEIRREYNISDEEEVDKNKCEQGTVNHLVYVLHGVQADVKVWSVGNAVYQSMYQEWIREKLRQMLENEEEREVGLRIIKEALFKGGIDKSVYNLHFREYVEAKFRERFAGYLEPAEEYYGNEKIKERAIGKLDIGEELREIGYRIEIDGLEGIEGVRALISYGPKVYVREGEGYVHIMQMLKERREDLYRGYIEYLRGEGLEELLRVGAYMIEEEQAVEMIKEVIGREEADERVKDMLRANIKEQPRFMWPVIRDMRGMGRENLYHLAVEANFWQMVKAILVSIENPNIPNRDGDTALLVALRHGCTGSVYEILKHDNICVNTANPATGVTPLELAFELGDVDVILELIGFDEIDVSVMTSKSRSFLDLAIKCGDVRVVARVLELYRGNINTPNIDGQTPIMMAVDKGSEEIMSLLLSYEEVDLNYQHPQSTITPLLLAIRKGFVSGIQKLLEDHRLNVNAKFENDLSYLHHLVKFNNRESLNAILARPELDLNTFGGELPITPLSCAIKFARGIAFRKLFDDPRIDFNVKDQHGFAALHYCLLPNRQLLLQLLIAKEAIDPNIKENKFEDSPLIMAVRLKNKEAARMLLGSIRVDVNLVNKDGYTALHLAVLNNLEEIVDLLLQRPEIDVNGTNDMNFSPLMIAVEKGNINMVKKLISHPSLDVNLRFKNGDTILMKAVRMGLEGIAKELINIRRFDLKARSVKGNSILHIAASNCGVSFVRELVESGPFDILEKDADKMNILEIAAYQGKIDMVKMLAEVLISTRPEGENLIYQILVECLERGDLKIIAGLINANVVDINRSLGDEGITPLMFAIDKAGKEVVKFLLQTGKLDINRYSDGGLTALAFAVIKGDVEIVRMLLDCREIDVNYFRYDERHNPLHIALSHEKFEIFDMLVAHPDININKLDINANTPLIILLKKGRYDIAEMLINRADVDLTVENFRGDTARSVALRNGQEHLVALIDQKLAARRDVRDVLRGASAEKVLRTAKRGVENLLCITEFMHDKDSEPMIRSMLGGSCSYQVDAGAIDVAKTLRFSGATIKLLEEEVERQNSLAKRARGI